MDLITIKSFLGAYYQELLESASQDKYHNTNLPSIFDQRFLIQGNKIQMIVDSTVSGLSMTVAGNEIQISQELYDHPNVVVSNSLEGIQSANPANLYDPEIFSTMAYLVCNNHTTIQIIGDIDEPIYVKYRSDYETFYNSVVVFNITNDINVEIIEEIESQSALNSVVNYVLFPDASLCLTTFYKNNISAVSLFYRNIIAQDGAEYSHTLFGKGATNVVDETKIQAFNGTNFELFGIINSDNKDFHSVLTLDQLSLDYDIYVDYRNIVREKSNVSFYPESFDVLPDIDKIAIMNITDLKYDFIVPSKSESEVNLYISDIVSYSTLERTIGAKRFYDNKTKFIQSI